MRRSHRSSRGELPSVSLNVIRCNNNPLHLQWVSRSGKTKKERNQNYSAPLINYRHETIIIIIYYAFIRSIQGYKPTNLLCLLLHLSCFMNLYLHILVLIDILLVIPTRKHYFLAYLLVTVGYSNHGSVKWIRATAEAEIVVIIGRWEGRVFKYSSFCFSLLLFHNIRIAYSSSWLNMPKYNVKVWWFVDSVPSTVTVLVFQH